MVGCGWGYTLSEAAQSGPATSSANGMISVVDGWYGRLWFVDYLVSSHWFLAVDRGGEADFWRGKKPGVSGKGLIVVHNNEVIWALVTHSYLMTKLTGFLLGKKVKMNISHSGVVIVRKEHLLITLSSRSINKINCIKTH